MINFYELDKVILIQINLLNMWDFIVVILTHLFLNISRYNY